MQTSNEKHFNSITPQSYLQAAKCQMQDVFFFPTECPDDTSKEVGDEVVATGRTGDENKQNTNKQTNKTNKQTNKRTNERTNEQTNKHQKNLEILQYVNDVMLTPSKL